MSVWGIPCWTLNHAGYGCGFRQRNIYHLLAEEDSRRLCYSTNSHAIPVTQIDFVTVERKNILLGESLLQSHCDQDFIKLAPVSLFRCQISVLDELLRDS